MDHKMIATFRADVTDVVKVHQVNGRNVARTKITFVSKGRAQQGQQPPLYRHAFLAEAWGDAATALQSVPPGNMITFEGKFEKYSFDGQNGKVYDTKVTMLSVGNLGPSPYPPAQQQQRQSSPPPQQQQQGYQQNGYPQQAPPPQQNGWPQQQQQTWPPQGNPPPPPQYGYPPQHNSAPGQQQQQRAPQNASSMQQQASQHQDPPALDSGEEIPF